MNLPNTESTLERIRARKARVGVIGLGYVGLPLSVEFAHAGFDVTGFDVDPSKIEQINAGKSYIPDVSEADLSACVKSGKPGPPCSSCHAIGYPPLLKTATLALLLPPTT